MDNVKERRNDWKKQCYKENEKREIKSDRELFKHNSFLCTKQEGKGGKVKQLDAF
jgi:hypothetical protein